MTCREPARLAFIDTETTSLRHDRRAWEIAVILRYPDGSETEESIFIDTGDLDLGNADSQSLAIGRFWTRHPQVYPFATGETSSEHDALTGLAHATRGAHLVGAVPSFDAEVLATRMRAHGILPGWHYHLVDVEALAAGALGIAPPWDSDDLTARLGVTTDDLERHTALGDANWAMRIYDAALRRGQPEAVPVFTEAPRDLPLCLACGFMNVVGAGDGQ